jgi:FtsP/CotA-like multicopper oxidase with cupredoxin domain
VHNLLPEGTTVHFHGLFVPNAMDGVPMVTQDPIRSGATFTYEFTAEPVGTHQYHSHMDDLKQVTSGLYGAFIVDPKRPTGHYNREFTLIPADGMLGFIINGKSFPDTTPLVVHLGESVRIRMINMGDMYHPFHLHGFDFREIAKDGLPIPEAVQLGTNEIDAAPGGSYDVAFTADRLGVWAFHCHILDHVTGPNGEMTGMITVVKVIAK